MQNKYRINAQFNNFLNAITDIKAIFSSSNVSIHKARNELKIIDIEDVSCVVKSFKVPNVVNQIAYSFFRDSKAKRSYEYSLKIKEFTPTPIAYIEFYSFGLLKESYFISERFNYDFTIREPLDDKHFSDRDKIFKAFAQFTLSLHDKNIQHNDYSPGNILVKKAANGEYIFKIVDINRMRFQSLSLDERAQNFAKLSASEEDLQIIAAEYTKLHKCDLHFISKVLEAADRHTKFRMMKKKLKGKK